MAHSVGKTGRLTWPPFFSAGLFALGPQRIARLLAAQSELRQLSIAEHIRR
jgi:hypothetical protein